MKQTLADIAGAIVTDPDSIVITEETNDNHVTLTLSVAPNDMGKVIGKNGRIANAIRMVMKSAANRSGQRVTVHIKD
ncbi:MAG: KH domain-containing protein [Clostridiales bacterium]|nr:KH domain-containing protein [Clostridiales bacterium]